MSFGFLGKYQLGEYALADAGFYFDASGAYGNNEYSGTWTDKAKAYGVTSAESFLYSPKAQDAAAREFHKKIWGYIRSGGYDQYIGSEVHGIKVTASGLIAVYHLVGIDGVGQTFGKPGSLPTDAKGIPMDANGTKSTEYLYKFGGLDLTDLLGYNPDR